LPFALVDKKTTSPFEGKQFSQVFVMFFLVFVDVISDLCF
jgi:hypothetical protein